METTRQRLHFVREKRGPFDATHEGLCVVGGQSVRGPGSKQALVLGSGLTFQHSGSRESNVGM